MTLFPTNAITEGMRWGQLLGEEWQREYPSQIHDSAIGADGTPRWHAEFARWLTNAPDPDGRNRTTKVMRRLRRVSPRSFEVLFRALILGESFEEITRWLNERAVRNRIELPPDRDTHYRVKDSVALFLCGVSYAQAHYGQA